MPLTQRNIKVNAVLLVLGALMLAELAFISVLLRTRNVSLSVKLSQAHRDRQELLRRHDQRTRLERRLLKTLRQDLDRLYRSEILRIGLPGEDPKRHHSYSWDPLDGRGGSDEPEDLAREMAERLLEILGGLTCLAESGLSMNCAGRESAELGWLVGDIRTRLDAIARLPVRPPVTTGRRLSSGFGIRRDPFSGKYRMHRGVDIAARRGAMVASAARGIIGEARSHPSRGATVIIDHQNGFQTVYAHLKRYFVEEGLRVRAGEIIGQLGNSGRSTGPHLHYEVRLFGKPLDPTRFSDSLQ